MSMSALASALAYASSSSESENDGPSGRPDSPESVSESSEEDRVMVADMPARRRPAAQAPGRRIPAASAAAWDAAESGPIVLDMEVAAAAAAADTEANASSVEPVPGAGAVMRHVEARRAGAELTGRTAFLADVAEVVEGLRAPADVRMPDSDDDNDHDADAVAAEPDEDADDSSTSSPGADEAAARDASGDEEDDGSDRDEQTDGVAASARSGLLLGPAPRTKHETVPRATVTLSDTLTARACRLGSAPDHEALVLIGEVRHVSTAEGVAVVEAVDHEMALDEGSLLCDSSRRIVGWVEDVFGRVVAPMYLTRLLPAVTEEARAVPPTLPDTVVSESSSASSASSSSSSSSSSADAVAAPRAATGSLALDVAARDLAVGARVFTTVGLARRIRLDQCNVRGTDASNLYDEEVSAGEEEFSDDELELNARRSRKQQQHRATVVGASAGDSVAGRGGRGRGRGLRTRGSSASGGGRERPSDLATAASAASGVPSVYAAATGSVYASMQQSSAGYATHPFASQQQPQQQQHHMHLPAGIPAPPGWAWNGFAWVPST